MTHACDNVFKRVSHWDRIAYLLLYTMASIDEYNKQPVENYDDSPDSPEKECRRLTAVDDLPRNLYDNICVKLSIRRFDYKDYRQLGESMDLSKDELHFVEHDENPADRVMRAWTKRKGSEATVDKLVEFVEDARMDRFDVSQVLRNWIETGKDDSPPCGICHC